MLVTVVLDALKSPAWNPPSQAVPQHRRQISPVPESCPVARWWSERYQDWKNGQVGEKPSRESTNQVIQIVGLSGPRVPSRTPKLLVPC